MNEWHLAPIEIPCEFAGSIHYVQLQVRAFLGMKGQCSECGERYSLGRINAVVTAVLNKARQQAGIYVQKQLKPLGLRRCRDGKILCSDCTKRLPLHDI